MPYYNQCRYCGSNLDPGERCECQEKTAQPQQFRVPERTDKFELDEARVECFALCY